MADELSLVLHSLAEYFNYFAVVLILLCSVLMTVFIVRHGEHLRLYRGGPGQGTSSLAFQRPMAEFCNPFFLRLSSHTASSLSEGVNLEVSSLVSCEMNVFWGVAINPLHSALLQTGVTFLDHLHSNSLLSGDSLAIDRHSLKEPGKRKLCLHVPLAMREEQLGPPPRHHYPCIIIMAVTNRAADDEEQNAVVALVTVIHVKDNQCRMDTHIMAQYAKLASKAVYNLQPLFFASEFDTDGSTGNPASQSQQRQKVSSGSHQHSQVSPTPTSRLDSSGDIPADSTQNGTESEERASPLLAQAKEQCSLTGDENTVASLTHPRVRSAQGRETNARDGSCLLSASQSNGAHGEPEAGQSDLSTSEVGEIMLPDCIVCQNQHLTCVLLPCRHACVCRSCFRQVDRCPMCRSHIESFFTLTGDDMDDEEEDGGDDQDAEAQGLRDWAARWEMLNQRLNDFLGFT